MVVSQFQSETFDISELVIGGSGDTGFDAIAIIVNGALVTDPETVDELAAQNKYLDVAFVFVQSERSASFSSQKIGNIQFGIEDFFKDEPTLPRAPQVSDAAAVMSRIYAKSQLFSKGNPSCHIFYVTTGKWVDDPHLEARRTAVESDLASQQIFSKVSFTPIGAAEIQTLHRQTLNAVKREFTFAAKTVVPEIPGVTESYLGLLPATEFLSIIVDDQGRLLKSVFYDNVRDWQDYNVVNSGIRDTLQSDSLRTRFALMNNGITIIAKTLRATGNRFAIEDFQIVNGCQTSHVIYDQRDSLDASVMVPVRLIATSDEDVTASIIKATNRQTEVKEEQLLALSDFQKKLEDYFATYSNGKRLYYERRSRQYNDAGIEKTRVVTMSTAIRAFAAMFRDGPHRTTRGYSQIIDEVGKTIFGPNHRLEPYYLAALAIYRLEFIFRNSSLDAKYKLAKYHTLLAFRMLFGKPNIPPASSHDMQRYCEPLMEMLWDSVKAEAAFRLAIDVVDAVAGGNYHRDHIRTKDFTDDLIAHCKKNGVASV